MLNISSKNLANKNWKKIVDLLVIENCLAFGDDSKYTQKKVTRYLLGTRATFEIFKLYELRYLLLKVYPFIQNLFYNPRLNYALKIKKLWNHNYKKQLETQRKLGRRLPSNKWKPRVSITSSFVQKKKNLTPQVLFATVTPKYTDIIRAAALICNMPSHENRWLNGSITAAISYQEDHVRWNYITDEIQAKMLFYSTQKWGSNKENSEKTKEKAKYYGESRWPALIIIPDLSKNVMIFKEAKKVGIPVMGLVNSSTPFQIDYPIFAQEQTVHSVHFFCHFLATLIAKEMIYIQHKRYILQKKKRQPRQTRVFKKKLFKVKSLNKKKSKDHLMGSNTKKKPFFRNTVFFRVVKPTTNDWNISETESYMEHRLLKLNGPYFNKSKWTYYGWRNPKDKPRRKDSVKSLKYKNKFSPKILEKKHKKNRKNKKPLYFEQRFFTRSSRTKDKVNRKKKHKQRGLPFLKKKLLNLKPKKHFKSLKSYPYLKILGRYLKKKHLNVKIIKTQKYLSCILNLPKKLRTTQSWPSRVRKNSQFLKKETFKKRFGFKENAFLIISEQKQLWKKTHNFLFLQKIINLQMKNKLLRFKKAKFHSEYKNYYAMALKQWRQTIRFQSAKHTLGFIFNSISYRLRLAKRLYYDANPAAWRAEQARLYQMRCWERSKKKQNKKLKRAQYSQNKQKENWVEFTEKNKKKQKKIK